MSDSHTEESSGVEPPNELQDALRAGLRRVGMHWMRAGYEVLAGVAAFLEEIAAAGKDGEEESDTGGPTKIELE